MGGYIWSQEHELYNFHKYVACWQWVAIFSRKKMKCMKTIKCTDFWNLQKTLTCGKGVYFEILTVPIAQLRNMVYKHLIEKECMWEIKNKKLNRTYTLLVIIITATHKRKTTNYNAHSSVRNMPVLKYVWLWIFPINCAINI